MEKIFAIIAVILAFSMILVSCGTQPNVSEASSEYVNVSEASEQSSSDDATSSEASKPSSSEASSETSSNISSKEEYTAVPQKTAAEKAKIKRAKILIMGDSFTSGDGVPPAYRYDLFVNMYDRGGFFEFVGDRTTSDPRLTSSYNQHMAQGGRKTDQLTEIYSNSVAGGKKKYDIALINIGLNDLYGGASVDELKARYIKLLDTMFKDRPDAKIFFSTVPDVPSISTDKMTLVNKMLKELVEQYAQTGKSIKCVDLATESDYNIDTGLLKFGPSGSHPNPEGYYQMGTAYANAIIDTVLEINKQPAEAGQKIAIDATAVTLSKTAATLKTDEQTKLAAAIAPAGVDANAVIWSVDNPAVATVTRDGLVTGVAAGKATVTARAVGTDIKAVCEITVTDEKFVLTPAGKEELFYEPFSDATNWDGNVDSITKGIVRLYYSGSKILLTSKESYTLSKEASSLEFTALVTGQGGSKSAAIRFSVSIGDYEIRVANNQENISLVYGNTVLGTYQSSLQYYPEDRFILNFVGGKVTLYRNNEVLITADAPAVPSGKIKINLISAATFGLDGLILRSGE